MSFNMHQAVVPGVLQTLGALTTILDKAEAEAGTRKIDTTVLLSWRLAPDMFALTRQIQLATNFAVGLAARLAATEVPKFEDNEKTITEVKARVNKAIDFIKGLKPAAFDGAESREVTVPIGGQPTKFSGQEYCNLVALPQFYFHATTAYNILRQCGIGIGKRDYLNKK